MNKYLKAAAKAWVKATLNVKRFADAYASAVDKYGEDARAEFARSYPMFGPREWKRLMLIGTGKLLPHFIFKSDFFVGKLLRLKNSMNIQKALVSASEDGTLRIDRGRGPEKVTLSELTAKEDKALCFLMNEEDSSLSADDLRAKMKCIVTEVNTFSKTPSAAWTIKSVGGRVVAHFNRACSMGRADLQKVEKALKDGRIGAGGRTSAEILEELCYKVKELEALRDEEWDFEEKSGHRDCWDKDTCAEHDELLGIIQDCRDAVGRLVSEALGKEVRV